MHTKNQQKSILKRLRNKQAKEDTYTLDTQKFNALSKSQGSIPNRTYISKGGIKAKIYSREIYLILTANKLPLIGKNRIKYKPSFFINDYITGYKNGTDYFKRTYWIRNLDLLTEPDLLIKNLFHLCYKQAPLDAKFKKNGPIRGGWIFYIRNYPFELSKLTIEEFGYYSGILNQVELYRGKYKFLFDEFFKP